MPSRLKRYQQAHHLHFISFTCFHRAPYLRTADAGDVVVLTLERLRVGCGLWVVGYVVMPEDVHLLIGGPERGRLALALQMLKQIASRKLRRLASGGPFWQAR